MILRNIKLENVRSYKNEEIEFPEDLILLSGNVGSGKSTILLAIDFALFGIRRGELSGNCLLRNGENHGKVILNFSIDDKEIEIKRTLKRQKDTVVQDSGYISINGEKKEGTAVELKQIILELLNYPPEMLTKKSLIYRYTIYTPQEEMKAILTGEKDFRVDTLRKVFGVDKYKNVKENALIFTRYLKEEIREMKGRILDYEEKLKQLEEKKKNSENTKLQLSRLETTLDEQLKEVKRLKDKIKKLEEENLKLKDMKHKLELFDVKIENETHKIKHNEIEITEIKKQIIQLNLDISKEVKVDDKQISKLKYDLETNKKKLKEYENKVSEFKIKVGNSNSVKNTINRMDTCPTCKRKVTADDKIIISNEEDNKISDYTGKIKYNEAFVLKLSKLIDEDDKELDRLRELKYSCETAELKKRNLKEKYELLKRLEEEVNISNSAVSNAKADKKMLSDEIAKFKNIETDYKSFKELLENALDKEKKSEIQKNSYEKDISNLNEIIFNLTDELKEKKDIKDKLNLNDKLLNWLQEQFINLVGVIEKKIMLRVHSDFDSLFKKWFDMLIDDELLKIKLDEEFTPLIEQNGYVLDYDHLSGGEKTAVALAYRLALNQVINHLISVIKTKDLLILDEPTDGFSDEQIEKMKDILNELDNKQTIIVSHENKIESFVNCVIKLEKHNHISSVVK